MGWVQQYDEKKYDIHINMKYDRYILISVWWRMTLEINVKRLHKSAKGVDGCLNQSDTTTVN